MLDYPLAGSVFRLTDKENALELIEKFRQKLTTDQLTKAQFNHLTSLIWEILKAFLQSPKDDKTFVKQIMQLSK